jgi:hypothetical protein
VAKMKIDLRKNGIHSLVEALRAFKKFHENPDAPDVAFALKDSILRAHHALETLFKKTLLQYNSVLLLEKDDKVGDFVESYRKFLKGDMASELEESRTINLKETIERVNNFGFIKIDKKEFGLFLEAIEKLERYRNRLQHLSLSADPDVIARILGIVLPRAIDILDAIPSRHPVIDYVIFDEPIYDILKRDFPEAFSTINLLRSNYDCLIDQAVRFFKGKVFRDLKLELLVEDSGTGWWGPPGLKAEGFLNFQAERFRIPAMNEDPVSGIAEYAANTLVSEPEYSGMNTFPYEGRVKGNLDFHAELKFRKAEELLVLPDSEENIPFLRDLGLTIDASLQYEAIGMKGGSHCDVREIQKSKGNLTIFLTAVPKGYEGEKSKIIAKYESTLDNQNAAFRFHCFLEPDGAIRDQNRHLEWKINAVGDLVYE